MICRCGYDGPDDGHHPCHGECYSCRRKATRRFYNPMIVSLSGHVRKIEISETWACDECWERWKKDWPDTVLLLPETKYGGDTSDT